MSKYPETFGRQEDVWSKLGGEDGVDRFLRGELVVSEPPRCWQEVNGIISLQVTPDGTTGTEWLGYFKRNNFRVEDGASSMLVSDDFKPTKRATTEIVILKGELFKDQDRTTGNILDQASHLKLSRPGAEDSCLVRSKIPDKEIEAMGLRWIVFMHEPINDFEGYSSQLGVYRGDGGRWLRACLGRPKGKADRRWSRSTGFAFVGTE